MEGLGVEWAIKVLERIRGTDFPAKKSMILEKLGGIAIKNVPIEKIVEKLPDTIKTSAELLHLIKVALQEENA